MLAHMANNSCALLIVQNEYNLLQAVCFGFAASLGFTLAIVVFAGVRVRMENADPPWTDRSGARIGSWKQKMIVKAAKAEKNKTPEESKVKTYIDSEEEKEIALNEDVHPK